MKNVLITGGTKGIGRELVRLFVKDKNLFKVYVVARSFPRVIRGIEKIKADLSNLDSITEIVSKVKGIDILINNAGMINSLPLNNYNKTARDYLMTLNMYAPVELIRAYIDGMVDNKFGRIVNVASIAGQIGSNDIWYGASKAGLINVTKSIAKIYGEKGIVVNSVAPGPVDTTMLHDIPEIGKENLKAETFLHRFATPEETAKTIYWLAVNAPEYINGTTIDVNNGMYMR